MIMTIFQHQLIVIIIIIIIIIIVITIIITTIIIIVVIMNFISAYPIYMKLAPRPKVIYIKKKYYTIKYYEIIS